jgi:para-nitrobenzyl esterase
MIAYWTRFARTGNPNGAGLPGWKPFTPASEHIQSLTSTGIRPAAFEAEHRLAFWRSLGLG